MGIAMSIIATQSATTNPYWFVKFRIHKIAIIVLYLSKITHNLIFDLRICKIMITKQNIYNKQKPDLLPNRVFVCCFVLLAYDINFLLSVLLKASVLRLKYLMRISVDNSLPL